MKWLWWIVVIVLLLVVIYYISKSGYYSKKTVNTSNSSSVANEVSIENFSFNPTTLTVSKGSSVTFVNNDSVTHSVVFDSFSSGNLDPGKSYSHVFETVGTFNYHCSIHTYMTGKIIVN